MDIDFTAIVQFGAKGGLANGFQLLCKHEIKSLTAP